MDMVVVIVDEVVPVLVTVVELSVLEDVSLPVVDVELVLLLPLGLGLTWEDDVVDNVSAVLELALPAELLVVEVLALVEMSDEPLPLVEIGVVELGELSLTLLEIPVDIDGVVPVVLSEGTENVPEIVIVVASEAVQLEALGAPLGEETVNPVAVFALESDSPDEVIVVVTPLVMEGVFETVSSVVAESVCEGIADDPEEFPEIGVCVVKKMVEVVSETRVVVLPEMEATDVELLDPVLVLLTIDPERELEGIDPPERLVDIVKLLLGVNPG
ncbi:hypothetical protein F5Y09DRAFT_346750 [Xylaria sp. FL1042]|nr:hypothetical protein F5Y09DRAFT_346750 [Xylaria sp. FL1042]